MTTKNALLVAAGFGMLAGGVIVATLPQAIASTTVLLDTDNGFSQSAKIRYLGDGGYQVELVAQAERILPDGGRDDPKQCRLAFVPTGGGATAVDTLMQGAWLNRAKTACGW